MRELKNIKNNLVTSSNFENNIIELSEEEMKILSSKIRNAKIQILIEQPFFGLLILQMKIIPMYLIDRLFTNSKEIYYNPYYFKKLDFEQIKSSLIHEILHCVLDHIRRGENKKIEIWEMATDYAIAFLLLESKLKLSKDHPYNEKYKNLPAESIYNELLREYEENNKINIGLISSFKNNLQEFKQNMQGSGQNMQGNQQNLQGTQEGYQQNLQGSNQITQVSKSNSQEIKDSIGNEEFGGQYSLNDKFYDENLEFKPYNPLERKTNAFDPLLDYNQILMQNKFEQIRKNYENSVKNQNLNNSDINNFQNITKDLNLDSNPEKYQNNSKNSPNNKSFIKQDTANFKKDSSNNNYNDDSELQNQEELKINDFNMQKNNLNNIENENLDKSKSENNIKNSKFINKNKLNEDLDIFDDLNVSLKPQNIDPIKIIPTEKDLEEFQGRMRDAFNAAKFKGDLPSSIQRYIEELYKSKISWQNILAKYLVSYSKVDYNWIPPSYKYLPIGLILPSIRVRNLDLVIGIDTSGSISNQELKNFLSEVKGLISQFNSYKIEIIACDAAIHEIYKFETFKPFQFTDALKLSGGGGTDFRPVFDHIQKEKNRPDCLIYMTDLEGTFPNKAPNYPVIWLSTTDKKAPFGITIKYEV